MEEMRWTYCDNCRSMYANLNKCLQTKIKQGTLQCDETRVSTIQPTTKAVQ